MTYIEVALYVLFGMVAGGPIWLLFLAVTATSDKRRWERERERLSAEIDQWEWQDCRPRRQQWRVIDSVCKRLGVR